MIKYIENLEPRQMFSVPAGNWITDYVDNFNVVPDQAHYTNLLWGSPTSFDETYTTDSKNLSVNNGVLSLTALKENLGGKGHTSACINTGSNNESTQPRFTFLYGYIEARMKLNKGNGEFPAFWLLTQPINGTYHDNFEPDIMEELGEDSFTFYQTYHHNGQQNQKTIHSTTDLSTSFHDYGLDIEPNSMTFYFDGVPGLTVSNDIVNRQMFFIINNQINDGTWGKLPDSSTPWPNSLQVDSVKHYKKLNFQPLAGDCDLNGKVDSNDLSKLSTNYNKNDFMTWIDGDFTKTGQVDVASLGLLATNYNRTYVTSILSSFDFIGKHRIIRDINL